MVFIVIISMVTVWAVISMATRFVIGLVVTVVVLTTCGDLGLCKTTALFVMMVSMGMLMLRVVVVSMATLMTWTMTVAAASGPAAVTPVWVLVRRGVRSLQRGTRMMPFKIPPVRSIGASGRTVMTVSRRVMVTTVMVLCRFRGMRAPAGTGSIAGLRVAGADRVCAGLATSLMSGSR